MNLSSDVAFTFQSDAADQDIFRVLQFNGEEKLGDLYQFSLQLLTPSSDINPTSLLDSACTFSIDCYGRKREFNGILSEFTYLNPTENGHLFQATLVPKLWLLTQFTTNEVYLGMNLAETLAQLFDEAGLTSDEYDLNQIRSFRRWDYRCQFGENHYNFLKRITEREGVYFYFEQLNQKGKATFCHRNNQHPDSSIDAQYSPVTGSSYSAGTPVIFQWTQHNQRVPREVIVKDYNNDQPSVDLMAKSLVDSKGLGEVFRYCDNLLDLEEAKALADIRAEELAMKKTQFFGASLDVLIAPAHPLRLTDHPFNQLNTEYLPIQVSHTGYAPDLTQNHTRSEQPYSNTIHAIFSETQFRPDLKTEKPRFYGVLNAIVDSEGDGKYAQLDNRGRYKVKLPFDRQDRDGAQASWWIPMSQPNAGDNSGMHFPLLKGAEVLLSFIGGDPDRPVITGAVPNASKPSIVREDNHTQNKIKTAANNIIEMEDEADSERIKLFSPNSNSYFHLGASNPVNASGLMMMTSGGYYQEIGGGCQVTFLTQPNFKEKVINNATVNLLDGNDTAQDLINERELFVFKKANTDDTGKLSSEMSSADERSGKYFIHREKGEKYTWTDGNTHTFGGAKDFSYGNSYEVNYVEYETNTDWDGDLTHDKPKGDVSKMLVSKTIGDAYEYHKGLWQECHYGNYLATNVGSSFIEASAIGARIEASALGADISATAAGVSLELDLSLIKFDIGYSGLAITYNDAFKEIEIGNGEYKKGVKKDISLQSGEIFKASSAAPLPLPPLFKNAKAAAMGLGATGAVVGVAAGGGAAGMAAGAAGGAAAGTGAAAGLAAATGGGSSSSAFELKFNETAKAELKLDYSSKSASLSLTRSTKTEEVSLEDASAKIKHSKKVQLETDGELTLTSKKNMALKDSKAIKAEAPDFKVTASKSANIDSAKVDLGKGSNNIAIASTGVTIKSGGNSFQMKASGVDFKASGQASIKAGIIQVG